MVDLGFGALASKLGVTLNNVPATSLTAATVSTSAGLSSSLPVGLGKPGTGSTVSVPLSGIERLSAKIAELQTQLQSNAPGYASLLHEIHTALAQDESLVHLLKEEEIGVVVSGLSKRKAIVIADAVKAKSTSKQLSRLSADDF